ncbi:hypothetical protein HPB47_018363 [Ixodes persulcatus]|uniref:Uncharacterized protein n=1 Tax=Ixodes persulcatus TaxID=34615 RepID=A0AC60QL31_IXOPE|nr:hypothetical protein HPB47_018363 [Ixodes persulcatus]
MKIEIKESCKDHRKYMYYVILNRANYRGLDDVMAAHDGPTLPLTIESAKGSGAVTLVDSGAAADRRSPVHFQHPGGSNEPGTSAWPSGDQGAQESEIIPPPTPPPRADHADTVQNDADDGDDSDCILIGNPFNGDIEENPCAVKREAGYVNSWDAKAGASFKTFYQEFEQLREEVGDLRQEVYGLKEMHAPAPAACPPSPVLPKLPMETKEDFDAVEEFLADERNFERMVDHLKSLGGSTLKDKAKGMMTGLFSLDLAATYNYKKKLTGKLVFVGTVAEKAVRPTAIYERRRRPNNWLPPSLIYGGNRSSEEEERERNERRCAQQPEWFRNRREAAIDLSSTPSSASCSLAKEEQIARLENHRREQKLQLRCSSFFTRVERLKE